MVNLSPVKSYNIFFRSADRRSALFAVKIRKLIESKFKKIYQDKRNPEIYIVLGGDGTILLAAKQSLKSGARILGLNMGSVGFLASARHEKGFLKAVSLALSGKCRIVGRTVADVSVVRAGKTIFRADTLNEALVDSPLGMVKLSVSIDGHPFQYIKGSGVLVATPTGSTAINLSAHGPIVAPDLDCFIVTELLDHTIPTPSIVVGNSDQIQILVKSFRRQGILKLKKDGQSADLLLVIDGVSFFPLAEGDIIEVKKHTKKALFVELEKNYFFKSLQERFGYK